MRFFVALALLICCSRNSFAQEDQDSNFNQDFFLRVDNDAFLAMAVDRYYSSGIFFQFRKIVQPESLLTRLGGKRDSKTIYTINFSHLFFTPSNLKLRTIDQFDRPYAGVVSVGFGISHFFERSHLKMQLDAGIMGPSAKVKEVQEWYHRLINAKKPRGWRFQVENSPLVTLNLEYLRSLLSQRKIELLADATIQAGTVFNNLRSGVVFRVGNFKPINNTLFNQSRLGTIERGYSQNKNFKESLFFVKAGMEYVLYDATVEGTLFGKESLHTETAQPWRYRISYGYMLGLRRWDFALAFNNVRRETKESRDHYYVTIDVIMRF